MSILKLADKYTAQRLENACAIALEHIPNPTYKNIRLILKGGQDEMISKENEDDTSIQEHAILRGLITTGENNYYGLRNYRKETERNAFVKTCR